jgi:hypothetical protein
MFTPEQYSEIAEGYEKASVDPLLAPEKQMELAKKAEWFHFLAQRGGSKQPNLSSAEAPLARSQTESRRTIVPFLTTLWVIGAGVYLLSTFLLTNAVNLSGAEHRMPAPATSEPMQQLPPVADVNKVGADIGTKLDVSRHAISPGQPAYEAPALTEPTSASPATGQIQASSSESVQQFQPSVEGQAAELFMVTSAAIIRNGPTLTARKIGTATVGAKLQVKGRERGWVNFVDPASGNTGWIQSSLIASTPTNEASLAEPQLSEPASFRQTKPKVVKKKWDRAAKATQLPPDADFLPSRRRGAGLFGRRRMLREGLMSPDFRPPE